MSSFKLLPNGIPHDAIILTNSTQPEEFLPSKVFAVPSYPKTVYPWEVEVHLTDSCGLSCKGCSYGKRHSGSSLSIEDIENVFYSIKNMGSHTLFFSGGGDPLHWNEWNSLIKIKTTIIPDVVTGISTNLITSRNCSFINVFFDLVQVHVVGFDVNSCKENTNVDCFDILNKNLHELDGYNCVIKILVNSANVRIIDKYLSFVCKFDVKTIILKLEQNFVSNEQLFDADIFEQLGQVVSSHQITSKYANLFYTKTDKRSLIMPSKCHVVDGHVYCLIRGNGDVYPCIASTYSNENSIGNIHDENLESIYVKNIDSAKFSTNMKGKKCPLGACRHFRFNQVMEKKENSSAYSHEFVPSLL